MDKRLRIALASIVIFLSGLTAGDSLHELRSNSIRRLGISRFEGQRTAGTTISVPMGHRLVFLRKAQSDLDITPGQRARVQAHLDAARERLRKMWEPLAPKFRSEVESLEDQIRGELTAPQRDQLDRILKGRNRQNPQGNRSVDKNPRN